MLCILCCFHSCLWQTLLLKNVLDFYSNSVISSLYTRSGWLMKKLVKICQIYLDLHHLLCNFQNFPGGGPREPLRSPSFQYSGFFLQNPTGKTDNTVVLISLQYSHIYPARQCSVISACGWFVLYLLLKYQYLKIMYV